MMTNPLTDKSFQVKTIETKFAQVRSKSKEHEKIRKTKKNKTYTAPKYRIGDEVVVYTGYKNREYCLVEILDIEPWIYNSGTYKYYGIILKTTVERMKERIGLLVHFHASDYGWMNGWCDANCTRDGIRWIE